MTALTFELKAPPGQRLDLSPLVPSALAGLKPKEIESIEIGTTREPLRVGDAFKLKGSDAAKLRFVGTNERCDRLGHRLAEGEIEVDGDAGAYLGAGMRGGKIVVSGSAGPFAGGSMRRGEIVIGGDAGERAAGVIFGETHGMRSGRMIIGGKAGPMLGERMRRGLVIVKKGADDYAGARMIAGTIIIEGEIGKWPGYGLRRGSLLLSQDPKHLLPTFVDSGKLTFEWLRLLSRKLGETGLELKLGPRARRLMGDMAVLGKGEILVLA